MYGASFLKRVSAPPPDRGGTIAGVEAWSYKCDPIACLSGVYFLTVGTKNHIATLKAQTLTNPSNAQSYLGLAEVPYTAAAGKSVQHEDSNAMHVALFALWIQSQPP